MKMSSFIIIPREITGDEELIVLPRRDFDKILKEKSLTEDDVLRWSREAKALKRRGKLPGPFNSVRDLRQSLEK